jgi:hypothetical protein
MTRATRRDSGFSLFRIGIFAAVIGILFLIGGFILVAVEQQTQRQPLDVSIPPNAQLADQTDLGSTSRTVYYFIPDTTAEDIANFYNAEMSEFYGTDLNAERCRRFPASGNFEEYTPGNGVIPYVFRCLFDTSGFQGDRFTEVEVQPGVRIDDQGINNEGSVVVKYTYQWQP